MLRLSLVLSAVMATAVLAQENVPMPQPPSASRTAPPVIAPITRDGVRYESRWSHRGVLFAVDEKSGKPLWQVEVYKYLVDEQVETDIQEVYFKSMTLDANGEALLIEDERGVRHQVDLKTRKAKLLTWPVTVNVVEASPDPDGWKYSVELKISNTLTRPLKLDGLSVAEKGRLSNNLFQVEVDGQPISYRGEMAKRAPPDRFIKLKPGATYSTEVELSSDYPVPPGKHRLTVRFTHRNHFSPDDCLLESKPVTVELGDEPIRRPTAKPKPKP
ncbi:hypothetical protein F0U61_45310 [Archangium violaceum]|uniref:hypothetical protein n=1 Tax=Archangium violaceum TaxID=83451 RepID=UPI002B29C655|nr:hypothetical protein F0U61_45310 [Archangium violaceum]